MRKVEPSGGAGGRRQGRLLAVFKGLILLGLMAATAYGVLNEGLYADELWLPVAMGVLALLLVTLFVGGFYRDVPREGWILAALLAVLVGVKGLSMVWTISETETIKETLRSSMYMATFAVALGALSSGRQVGPLMDVSILMAAAVAGYGILQKISPVEYPVSSLDGVIVDSTLEYANTTAVILGMGAVLALARMTATRNAVFRGLYAALILAFVVVIYLTGSRGGMGSLGIGFVVLFVLGKDRLGMLVNLLLLSLPGAWLFWRMRGLDALMQTASQQQKVADGVAFRTDLLLALVAAFVLQAGYALVTNRYELTPAGRRALGALGVAVAVLVAGAGAFGAVRAYGGAGQAYEALLGAPDGAGDAGGGLVSLSVGFREDYWRVGLEAWKEHPLTGTGAGTFRYTWLENRPGPQGVLQIHNLYLEQGTETGLFAFLALAAFVVILLGYTAKAAWLSGPEGERRLLLAGLVSALVVYLVSSAFEWHWYLPASTLFFFILAAVAAKFASRKDWGAAEQDAAPPATHPETDDRPARVTRWRPEREGDAVGPDERR